MEAVVDHPDDALQVLVVVGADLLVHRRGLRHGIAAGFADGGKHFGGDPLLELLGFRFAAAEDQGVEAGFVDDPHFLVARGGVH